MDSHTNNVSNLSHVPTRQDGVENRDMIYSLSPLGGPELGYQRCFADVTNRG